MKKIGILTFHRSINYGAYMQCLSLSRFLSKQLPDCKVEVIDYESKIMHDIYVPKITLSCIKHPGLYFLTKKKYAAFLDSLKHLPLSDKYFCSDGVSEALEKYITDNYDAVIVGSDAVWNWVKRGFPNPYLLGFGSDIKKFSYAASAYGMSMDHVGEKETAYFSEALKSFSFIGYRDEYTKALVNTVCPEAEPTFTCDPTLFLDMEYVLGLMKHTKESFKEYIFEKYKLPKDKILIGAMETSNAVIEKVKKHYGDKCYVVCVYNYLSSADKYIADLNPLEWSQIFSLFDITITNYFHGTLLSLKNNTPIISIDRTEFSKKYEGKIHDVLRRMDLLDCYFTGEATSDEIIDKVEFVLANKSSYKTKIETNLELLAETKNRLLNALKEVL